MASKQRLDKLTKEVNPKYGEPVPILLVFKDGEIIKTIDGVKIGADEQSQAEAQRRIDNHPRSDDMPTVAIIFMPDNERG